MEEQKQEQMPAQPAEPMADEKDVKENKAITFLSYIGLLFLVPLLAKKDSKFAQFHAKQGLVITIGWVAGSFLYILMGLGALVHLLMLVFSIMGLINVNNGKMKKLPVVGDLAEKFNI
jgi:uncharacterized membrane protein